MMKFLPLFALILSSSALLAETILYRADFATTKLGRLPLGWESLGPRHVSPTWGVDGRQALRVLWKGEHGVAVYDGPFADGKKGDSFEDGTITATFRKTPDLDVSVGVVGRLRNDGNFYVARFSGEDQIELLKVTDGQEEVLAKWVTLARCPEGADWTLSLAFAGPNITARVLDGDGREQARVDALDENGFASGRVGVQATNYASVAAFRVEAADDFSAKLTQDQLAHRPDEASTVDYLVLPPEEDGAKLDTPFAKLTDSYDIVVAGAGTGGWATAVQAARMGAKVLLTEESDWIGGQMAAAAVTTMDEEGLWNKFPVRERGIYREFHESMVNYYYTLNKDPFSAYYAWPKQLEGGYEPKKARAMLYAFINEARRHGTLELALTTRVTSVKKEGDTIVGVELEHVAPDGRKAMRNIGCRILVDATEYGDVIPLTGSRYRVGNVISDKMDHDSLVQDYTWTAVIREYPKGVPEHLLIKQKPPGYDEVMAKKYRHYKHTEPLIWGSAGKGQKGGRHWRSYFAWRGMADSDSPMTGTPTEGRHTQCGLNGGNDYPASVKTVEDPQKRREDERLGIYQTLCTIYYFQNELGLPWSLAEDEGYKTPYNVRKMKERVLRPDLLPLAEYMPQWPYVRESRRAVGIYTLKAKDLGRFEKESLFPNAVALGDYYMDLHRTDEAFENDLDTPDYDKGGGPFQVPFEAFIPEKLDGFLLAEKNFSQSRLVNGATRLQPITMLTGQAVGTIAALAIKENVPPRKVNPIAVQNALLQEGSNLVQRWYADVAWGTPLWQATQLLTLHGVMDRPGPYVKNEKLPLGGTQKWGADEPLTNPEWQTGLDRLNALTGKSVALPPLSGPMTWADLASLAKAFGVSPPVASKGDAGRKDFALVAAEILKSQGRSKLLSDR